MNTIKFPFYFKLTIVLICIVFTVLILREGSALLIPLFAGLLLAVLLLPIAKFLERMHIPRVVATFLALLCFLLLLFLINYFLVSEISVFSKELPSINTKVQNIFISFQHLLSEKFNIDHAQQSNYFKGSFNDAVNELSGFVSSLVFSFGNILIWTFFVCIYSFCILYYRKLIVRFLVKLVENDYPNEMIQIIAQIKKIISSYIMGLLVEFLMMLTLNSALLFLVGIKYALMLAIIAAILNVIPYIGIYTATALAMIITYANSSGADAIKVGIVLIFIHLIDGIIIIPKIVGARVKMNPFITIIAVIAGDIVWGIPGMFLFIPFAAMLKIVFENIPSLHAWAILFGEDEKLIKLKK
ncbi:MAG: AI-2E family transporter [Chitinophagaceae bacterium]|nr:AI-2E family transporter [Chitinophagaceae bacterium]